MIELFEHFSILSRFSITFWYYIIIRTFCEAEMFYRANQKKIDKFQISYLIFS